VNRRALQLLITPEPARLRFATKPRPRARQALIEWMARMIELGEQE
jgi:hypothetical protein